MSISCWGGVWLVAVLVSTFLSIFFFLGGGGSHVGESSVVALVQPQQLIDISSDSVMRKGIPITIVRVRR
jgi:hypothetical protein